MSVCLCVAAILSCLLMLSVLGNERNGIGILNIVVFYFCNIENLVLFYVEVDVFSYLLCEILIFII